MRELVVGLLAHVDAGKTTLAEAMLYQAGAIRTLGRVDHGDSHLDVDAMERRRGITIFANQASLEWGDVRVTLVDAPGHVDFSAEAERTLQALDCAVLVIGATDGVQGHTRTLWRLLEERGIPTFLFVNKTDLVGADADAVLEQLQGRLSPACFMVGDGMSSLDEDALETVAMASEESLDEYLETGSLSVETLRDLVSRRQAFPCLSGSALRGTGVQTLLDALCQLGPRPVWPDAFAARVYKVSRSPRGERLAWLHVTGGVLHPRDLLEGMTASRAGRPGEAWCEKVGEVRVSVGTRLEPASQVVAGQLCVVSGLSHVVPGDALGAEPADAAPRLEPVLLYRVEPGECDVHAVLAALRQLEDEDPMLGVSWSEQLQELRLRCMGPIQLEVVRETLSERFGLDVGFGPGSIAYRETIAASVAGVGHFEPLRHYAEVHLLLEPGERGSGVEFGSVCSEDDLDRNWQRLALTNAMEREHRGVLVGSPLTDVRITLVGGRAHPKHTEGGDFRQATYRAIRQALMEARQAGECVLLEPWYRFVLEVPADRVGRAMADLQRMSATFEAPSMVGEMATVEGVVPVSEVREYAIEVAAYSQGRGSLSCELDGYRACHDAQRVIEEAAYDPEADLDATPDSVFCAHGAGYTVKWADVPAHAHVDVSQQRRTPWRPADADFFGAQ